MKRRLVSEQVMEIEPLVRAPFTAIFRLSRQRLQQPGLYQHRTRSGPKHDQLAHGPSRRKHRHTNQPAPARRSSDRHGFFRVWQDHEQRTHFRHTQRQQPIRRLECDVRLDWRVTSDVSFNLRYGLFVPNGGNPEPIDQVRQFPLRRCQLCVLSSKPFSSCSPLQD